MIVLHESFIQLVRLGVGTLNNCDIPKELDWILLKALVDEQGLPAVVIDGIEQLPESVRPTKDLLLQWIGETLQGESQNAVQQKAAMEMANFFHSNCIKTFVLKGAVIAECYPKPNHRVSVDMDCYLSPADGIFDAWALGNDVIKGRGFTVDTDFYKNSTFHLPGLTVENHQYLTPFRGNK